VPVDIYFIAFDFTWFFLQKPKNIKISAKQGIFKKEFIGSFISGERIEIFSWSF